MCRLKVTAVICRWTHHDFDPSFAGAVEVWGGLWNGPEERNQGCLDLWREWLNTGRRLTATGATDAHRPEDWEGEVPATYVHASDASLGSILEALRAGRTYVSSGPMIEIHANGERGASATVGEAIGRSTVREIEAKCANSPEAELRLVSNRGTIAKARVDADGQMMMTLHDLDAWCCAELWNRAGDTLLAVTSPIYFV